MSALNAETHFLVIAGPTASGKSSLALDLAKKLNGTIINSDSMQIYQDLPILTASPSADDMAEVPHRLYQHIDGRMRCSVGHWLSLASEIAEKERSAGRLPIFVGGTGMYLQAALNGISPIPDVSDEIQAKVVQEHKELGGAHIKNLLAEVDPILGERLEAADSQRLVRALAVYRQTNEPLSKWQQLPGKGQITGKSICLALLPDRALIYQNINDRFDIMMAGGAMAEVKALLERNLDPTLPVMKALGVSAMHDFLRGEHDIERAIYLAKRDSRHYAKRQMTWLRNNYIPQITINEKYLKRNLTNIFSNIMNFS